MPITKFRDIEDVPPPPALATATENVRLAFELSELALALGRAGARSRAGARTAAARTAAPKPKAVHAPVKHAEKETGTHSRKQAGTRQPGS